jgi:transposase
MPFEQLPGEVDAIAAYREAEQAGKTIQGRVRAAVNAAAPYIRAAERERLRQAAADLEASVYDRQRDEWVPLAALMTDLPPIGERTAKAVAAERERLRTLLTERFKVILSEVT